MKEGGTSMAEVVRRALAYGLVLAVVIAPCAVAVAWFSSGALTAAAVRSATIGGGVCWLAAAMALTVTALGNHLRAPVQGMLMAMMIRMGLPLLALVTLPRAAESGAGSSLAGTILGVYLVALVVETSLSLRMVGRGRQVAGTGSRFAPG